MFFSVIIPVITTVLIIFFREGKYARIYATLLSSILFAIPIAVSIIKRGKMKLFDKECWSFLLKYTLPSLPHYISTALIWQIGKIIVANNFSSAEAGFLSLAISVGLLPTLITLGMQSALIPWITRKLDTGVVGQKKIYSLIRTLFLPICLVTTLFLLMCPELFRIMSAKDYHGALGSVYPIAASVPQVFLTNLFCAEISYYKKTHLVAIGSVSGAVLTLFFNLLFTFKVGYTFSAFLMPMVFFFMSCVYILILKRKFSHCFLPARHLAKTYFVFLLFVGVAAFLRISFLARALLSIAVIMTLFPKLKELRPLWSE